MTPPAATAAARTADPRALRRTGPAAPRRVSGPARGRAAAGARPGAARTRINAAPSLSRAPHARAHRAATVGGGGFAVGAGVLSLPGRGIRTAVRSVPSPGGLSDRLLRSRAWIGVVAGLLIGLVFLQVSLLKVNASIGQSVQASTALAAQNDILRSQIAALSEDGRITLEAENKLGMVMPTADAVRYLGGKGGVGGAGGAVSAADGTTDDALSANTASADAAIADDGSTDDTGATAADDGSGDATAADDGGADTSAQSDSADSASADPSTDGTAAADDGAAASDSGGAVAPSAG